MNKIMMITIILIINEFLKKNNINLNNNKDYDSNNNTNKMLKF